MNVHDYLVDEPISLSLAKFKFILNNDTQCILILPGCQQSDVQVQGTEVHKAQSKDGSLCSDHHKYKYLI